MINKLRFSKPRNLNQSDCFSLLSSHQFKNITKSSSRSTFDLFEADFNGKHFFIKMAHSGDFFGQNLLMQNKILAALYPQLKSVMVEDSPLNYLAIPSLKKLDRYSFTQVNELLIATGKKSLIDSVIPNGNSIESMIHLAHRANSYFYNKSTLDQMFFDLINNQIKKLEDYLPGIELIANHGDVSNPNIFLLNGDLILLDWEDVMLGFPGYDQVYWLTFLANSDQINLANLQAIPAPLDIVHATFFLVVILKEYFTTVTSNKLKRLPTQERVSTLLKLPKFRQF